MHIHELLFCLMSRQYVDICSKQPQEVLYPFLRKESVIAVKDNSLRPSKRQKVYPTGRKESKFAIGMIYCEFLA